MKQDKNKICYRGRFAPTPSGPLHFGSIVTAVASFLEARAHEGEWLVRIEDIDIPRTRSGMDSLILHTLENFGFVWTGEVVYQHRRLEAYRAALDDLRMQGLVYECLCSRKDMSLWPRNSEGEAVYSGICRNRDLKGTAGTAWRLNVKDAIIAFTDLTFGKRVVKLKKEIGDFVLRRKDGLFTYQLAVVVDDAWQEITDIVRGGDLLVSTGRQIYLQQVLHFPNLSYRHLPVVVDASGKKLSKQNYAQSVEKKHESFVLCKALLFLGQNPPKDLERASVEEIWSWAQSNWYPSRIPQYKHLSFSGINCQPERAAPV